MSMTMSHSLCLGIATDFYIVFAKLKLGCTSLSLVELNILVNLDTIFTNNNGYNNNRKIN